MSKRPTLSSNSIVFRRDSFDRYGDDLCALLLSYLEISECFRYECVSKQFKRLIFNGQKKLWITTMNSDHYIPKEKYVIKLVNRFQLKEPILESILRKCRFITDLNIDSAFRIKRFFFKYLLNCRHLKSLVINNELDAVISCKRWKLFGANCGQNLEVICFTESITKKSLQTLFRYAPNLKSISGLKGDQVISAFIDDHNQPVLPKLVAIIFNLKIFSIEEFKRFVDAYHLQIKELSITFNYIEKYGAIEYKTLMQLSRFENIEKFTINFVLTINQRHIINGLHSIRDNCKKLTELQLSAFGHPLYPNASLILPNNFASLRTLKLYCIDTYIDLTKSFFQSLKLLTLFIDHLRDNNLRDIHLFLPQLIAINLLNQNLFNRSLLDGGLITDEAIRYLAKLTKLRRIWVKICKLKTGITDEGVCYLINNCHTITTIQLICDANITAKSYDAFYERAKQNPKTLYRFHHLRQVHDNLCHNKLETKNFILKLF